MTTIRKLLVLGTTVLITGCSGFLYETVSDQELQFYSQVWYFAHTCKDAGFISQEEAAKAMSYASSRLPRHQSGAAQAKVKEMADARTPTTQRDCDGLMTRVMADGYTRAAAQQAPIRPARTLNDYLPKTTVCNKAFNQVYCTTN